MRRPVAARSDERSAEIAFDGSPPDPHNPLVIEEGHNPKAISQVYGAAVDLAFLTEMSNLSPPIIHPPRSSL